MQTSAAMISQSTAYDTQKAGANKPAPFPTRSSITRTLAVSLTLLTFLLPIVFTLLLDTLVLSRSSKGTASSPPPEVLRSEGMESVLVWRATERRNGCLWDSQIEATTTTPTLVSRKSLQRAFVLQSEATHFDDG